MALNVLLKQFLFALVISLISVRLGPHITGLHGVAAVTAPSVSKGHSERIAGFITHGALQLIKKLLGACCLAVLTHNCLDFAIRTVNVSNSRKQACCYVVIIFTPLITCLEHAAALYLPDLSEYLFIFFECLTELLGAFAFCAFWLMLDDFNKSAAIEPTPGHAGLMLGAFQYIYTTSCSLPFLLSLEYSELNTFWIRLLLKTLIFLSEQGSIWCIRLHGREARHVLREFRFLTILKDVVWAQTFIVYFVTYFDPWGIETVVRDIFCLATVTEMMIASSLLPRFFHPSGGVLA